MVQKILLIQALSKYLDSLNVPVVTDYMLGLFIFKAYKKKSFNNQTLRLQKDNPTRQEYSNLIKLGIENGILIENKNFPKYKVFNIIGAKEKTAEELICITDPFAYISHLSAMEFHGLTNRFSQLLYISRPNHTAWKAFAEKKLQIDFGKYYQEYCLSGFPKLTRPLYDKINKRIIHSYSSLHLGAYKNNSEQGTRISTIGRTFLDMVRKPELCGGINHVIEVYEEHAAKYMNLITAEISQHGNQIEKARAGYLLEDRIGISHPQIEEWKQNVTRGGSRKLDPSAEFSSTYSEKWCLSLNIIE